MKLCFRLLAKAKGGGTFVMDHLKIKVRGGKGGQGLRALGGIGGDGGDVCLVAKRTQNLEKMISENPKLVYRGETGCDSRRMCILGDKGKSCIIEVPMGITISDEDERPLAELNKPNHKITVARGGDGGSPKSDFLGQPGTSAVLNLDLKLIADFGLVGFPNAGKSTLLAALSSAKPKIAQYPFTTVRPQIGIINYPDMRAISVADLPGLIEGAHRNVGMGHKFLKHVERTLCMLVLVDVHGFQLNRKHPFRTPLETVLLLNKEIELYDPTLLRKPAILCLNKMDTPEAQRQIDQVMDQIKGRDGYQYTVDEALRPAKMQRFTDIVTLSAQDKDSVESLKQRLRTVLDELGEARRLERGLGWHEVGEQQRQLEDKAIGAVDVFT